MQQILLSYNIADNFTCTYPVYTRSAQVNVIVLACNIPNFFAVQVIKLIHLTRVLLYDPLYCSRILAFIQNISCHNNHKSCICTRFIFIKNKIYQQLPVVIT